jgi:hypothetical protein
MSGRRRVAGAGTRLWTYWPNRSLAPEVLLVQRSDLGAFSESNPCNARPPVQAMEGNNLGCGQFDCYR